MMEACHQLQAEALLIQTLIPGILRGLSNREMRGGRVVYSNVRVIPDVYDLRDVWNVYCDVEIDMVGNDDNYGVTHRSCNDLWLASIPRFNDAGLLVINGKYYHTVMRQRLIPNVPISFVRYRGDDRVVSCMLRSENMETLESMSLRMYRQSRQPKSVVMELDIGGSKPMDVLGYMRYRINHVEWISTTRLMMKLLRASTTIQCLINLLIVNAEDTQPPPYVMPSTVSASGEHYYTLLGDVYVCTECVIICQMLIKFLSVESCESEPDDLDDYRNKIVDDYGNIMGKLFRKLVMKCGINVANVSDVRMPKIYDKLLDAFTYNRWEVVDMHDSKLQISRIVDHSSPNCIQAALDEIVIISSAYLSANDIEETYDVRMIHPSQHGFVCVVRTADDTNAGMRLYLASDCTISRNLYTFGVSSRDDNMRLRNILQELTSSSPTSHVGANMSNSSSLKTNVNMSQQHVSNSFSWQTDAKIWIHNGHIVGLMSIMAAESILSDLKSRQASLSFSIHDTIDSRDFYGRFMYKATLHDGSRVLVDTREIERLRHMVAIRPSNFSRICYEIPYMNRMPVARTMLATKIMQKCISAHPPLDTSVDYSQLIYSQDPMIITTKSSGYCYGYNALVCYCTYRGMGIEDGIIVNKSSVERGLFMIYKRVNMIWYKPDGCTVTDYIINTKINSEVKDGTVIVAIVCRSDNGEIVTSKIKHTKPYICKVDDIELTFDTGSTRMKGVVAPKFLVSVSVSLTRCKRFRTGDKLSSRSAQKAVAVSILNDCDMPVIMDYYNINNDVSNGREKPIDGNVFRRYPATVDMIINPLSIISRCTVSQDITSSLGIIGSDVCAKFVHHPFGHTEISYVTRHDSSDMNGRIFNVDDVHGNRVVLMDGCTGEVHDCEATIGIEYYMVLNHIADTKSRISRTMENAGSGNSMIKDNKDSQVRYNWQELSALIHAKANTLISTIYNNTGEMGYYPYCDNCERCVDVDENADCCYCKSPISSRITMPKSFMTTKKVSQVLGMDMHMV
jgi:DNA-directed RNA polymerase beta subunit